MDDELKSCRSLSQERVVVPTALMHTSDSNPCWVLLAEIVQGFRFGYCAALVFNWADCQPDAVQFMLILELALVNLVAYAVDLGDPDGGDGC